ncbi:MAG: tRNA uridine-5-carboxymethylaminomethyl(34) synthesis enzyme MnmG [Clostridia bacterium]|nr:tRNA uridine-5-carboxymethylaminomethyl(34) synthesis enzyme MnmG [Clostridia bacterium]
MELSTKIAVIGAGHAGVEAALAASRMGVPTVLFTLSLDAIANMPCNPSIGGSGKGHLVYEIDALGGEMGYATDRVTLQSRTLNLGKGAAVHARRVQADRMLYRQLMKETIEHEPNLRLVQTEITDILFEDAENGRRVCGVRTALGEEWRASRVILATGTYLSGAVFIGSYVAPSGPDGMLPANALSASLAAAGVKMMRFKTGTPARVSRRSIDLSVLEEQRGEENTVPFSVRTDEKEFGKREQISCHIVYTNKNTHDIIRSNLDRSAMYSGNITGTGPRYCPSIETKIVRFADKERHQLFVEPTGTASEEMYISGFSTSMPADVQHEMIRSLPGFERAEIMRYGYAIEYDCIDPLSLYPTLAFKDIEGLYGAGQFNGTSGYEEAAAQGLVAGINAALAEKGEEPMILSRSSSYIGTLIDDLVTKGTDEPYRMMTSRSEYRLLLRQDNADLRLSDVGHRVGLLSSERYAAFCEKRKQIEDEIARLEKATVPPSEQVNALLTSLGSTPLTTGVHLAELLRRPEVSYASLAAIDRSRPDLPRAVRTTVEVQVKYEGYIHREKAEAERTAKLESKKLPADIDYLSLKGLRIEAAEKLAAIRPLNVGQAARISGVNPADITVLLIYLKERYGRE